jgi:hypothetical protein
MSEYYKLNTPVAVDQVPQPRVKETKKDLVDDWIEPVTEPEPEAETPKLRGSLADSISKTKQDKELPKKSTGPSRI